MAIQLLIDGVDKTSLLQRQTLSIKKAINERSLFDFQLKDVTGTYRPAPGQSVQLYDGATLVFGGIIDEVEEYRALGNSMLVCEVPANDYHEIADRVLVAETYTGQTAGAIIEDIRSKYLNGEGVTAGTIQTGVTISKAVFNYIPVSQAYDEISEITGFQWEINPSKALSYFDRSTYAAPWGITSTSAIRNVKVRKDRSQYRNRQYLRAGKQATDNQTREFAGDGKTTVFAVDYPIAETPTITVNAVAKTVGIRGVETGKDWYWNKNDKSISQDSSGVALISTDTLTVVYKGYYPIIAVINDSGQIDARKAIEGGTGVYERIESKESIDSSEAAIEYAEGILRRYAKIGNVLTYETDVSGLDPGMLQNVVLPVHDLNDYFLISQVTISDPGFQDQGLRYNVTALDGEAVGGWSQFFRKIVQSQQTFVIRDNEILLRYIQAVEPVAWSETITETVHACPIPCDDTPMFLGMGFYALPPQLLPADDLYPC